MEEISAENRRAMIAQMVEEDGEVQLAVLVKMYQVTETTIRRDLTILEEEGKLKRVHGGAVPMIRSSRKDSFEEKTSLHLEVKEQIGKIATQLIHQRDVVIVDSGTTTLQIGKHMPVEFRQNGAITLVTNSIPIINEVYGWPSPNLVMLGGIYLPDYQATVGPQTIAQLRELTADIVFLGADGLTINEGVSTSNILMGEVDRVMVESSRKVVVVTDSSKFGRVGFFPVAALDKIDVIITDKKAPADIIAAIKKQGIEVILV